MCEIVYRVDYGSIVCDEVTSLNKYHRVTDSKSQSKQQFSFTKISSFSSSFVHGVEIKVL